MKYTHKILPCLLALALTATAHARFAGAQAVPVDRLVEKAFAYLQAHKTDADAYYTLGRIHYLAFHLKSEEVPAFGDDASGKPHVAEAWAVGIGNVKETITNQGTLIDHAAQAVKNFSEACNLDPKNGLYALGYASILEDFQKLTIKQLELRELPEGLNNITLKQICDAYARAFALSIEQDQKIQRQPLHGLAGITAYEAATALVRLLGQTREEFLPNEQKILEDAKAAVAKFEHLPMGPVTPIVFSFEPVAHLAELLDPVRTVDFDLRGYGPREQWSWVRPQLGLLVWDPAQRGEITSASQLFGGYTFQLFWKNGYAALAALDDNSDGQLTGGEMKGISVWFDKNGDGRSTPDEVTPAEKLGITAIAVTAESQDGIHPTAAKGITLRDGRTLRSWDWITTPQPFYFQAMK